MGRTRPIEGDPDPEEEFDAYLSEVASEEGNLREYDGVSDLMHQPEEKHTGRRLEYEETPAVNFVKSINKDYMTTKEVAEKVGVAESTIRKWSKQRIADAPSYKGNWGRLVVNIYTPEDVENLIQYNTKRLEIWDGSTDSEGDAEAG